MTTKRTTPNTATAALAGFVDETELAQRCGSPAGDELGAHLERHGLVMPALGRFNRRELNQIARPWVSGDLRGGTKIVGQGCY